MPVSPIQTSFLGGELAPAFHGRVDLDVYRQGARELFNALPSAGGSLRGRQGSLSVFRPPWSFPKAGHRGKVVVLPGAGRHGYLATFYDAKVRVLDIDGFIECLEAGRDPIGAAPEQITSGVELGIDVAGATVAAPEGPETGSNWNNVPLGERDQNVASYSGGTDRYLAPTSLTFAASVRLGYSGWAKYEFTAKEVGTHRLRFTIAAEDALAGSQLRIQVGFAEDFNEFKGTIQGNLMFETFSGLGLDPQVAHVVDRTVEVEVDITDTSKNLALVFKFLSLHGPDDYLFYENPEKNSVCFNGVSLHAPSGRTDVDTPYNEYAAGYGWVMAGDLGGLSAVPLPSGTGVYKALLLHSEIAPQILEVGRNGSITVSAATGTFDPVWGSGNYPTVGTVWQGRLWLSGCAQNPDRFWASKPGEWLDFSPPSSPPTADDAMDFEIGRERIRWMAGAQTFFIGTDVGEYALHAASGVVSPLDFQLTQQSGFGGAAVQAPLLGNAVGYVSADRKRLRTTEFSNERGGWWSRDITATIEHRLQDAGIAEVVFAPSPDPTILARLDDGTFAACLFNPAAGVAAWSRFEIGGAEADAAKVTTLALSRGPDGARAWFIMRRTGTGEETWSSVESILLSPPGDDAHFMDGAWRKTASVAGPSSMGPYLGLEAYNGQVLDVWVNGERFGLAGTIVAGSIEFNAAAKAAIEVGDVVEWGWSFTRRAKLLGLDVPGPKGTGQGTKRRSPRIVLRLTEGSSVPRVNGSEYPKAFAGAAGEGSLDYVVASEEWGRGMVTLETADASPFELLAVMQVTQANEV